MIEWRHVTNDVVFPEEIRNEFRILYRCDEEPGARDDADQRSKHRPLANAGPSHSPIQPGPKQDRASEKNQGDRALGKQA